MCLLCCQLSCPVLVFYSHLLFYICSWVSQIVLIIMIDHSCCKCYVWQYQYILIHKKLQTNVCSCFLSEKGKEIKCRLYLFHANRQNLKLVNISGLGKESTIVPLDWNLEFKFLDKIVKLGGQFSFVSIKDFVHFSNLTYTIKSSTISSAGAGSVVCTNYSYTISFKITHFYYTTFSYFITFMITLPLTYYPFIQLTKTFWAETLSHSLIF